MLRLVNVSASFPITNQILDVNVTAPGAEIAGLTTTPSSYLDLPSGGYQTRYPQPGIKTVIIDSGAINLSAGRVCTAAAIDPKSGGNVFQSVLLTNF